MIVYVVLQYLEQGPVQVHFGKMQSIHTSEEDAQAWVSVYQKQWPGERFDYEEWEVRE